MTPRTRAGVDSTAAALGLARPQLGFLPPACTLELAQADMHRWLRTCQRQYSLVLASFAVHHLSRSAKAELLGHVARCLQPGGAFVLIDVFKLAGESREAYMLRLKDYLDAELTDGGWNGAGQGKAGERMHRSRAGAYATGPVQPC
jgi:hypothetical protein